MKRLRKAAGRVARFAWRTGRRAAAAGLHAVRRALRPVLVSAYFVSTAIADAAGRLLASIGVLRTVSEPLPVFGRGVTVIIPERDSPDLLRECLSACRAAAGRLHEPCQVVVVVNGCAPEQYDGIRREFPHVEFVFSAAPLGFSRAIERGLAFARHDWVYLLNSDMVLEADALAEIARYRAPHVFAVASQIFFKDPLRRREETGWTDFRVRDGMVEIFDVPPEKSTMARGNCYAGGGASLFRKSLLLRVLDRSHPYDPFYWEDVEWGALAWRLGYESLFCPASRAWHYHRATVSRFYSKAEIERIFRINAFRFQMRNLSAGTSKWALFEWLLNTDGECFRMLLSPAEVARTLCARFRHHSLPFPQKTLEGRRDRFCPAPQLLSADERPCVIVVTPFAVYPPLHGSARRTSRIVRALAGRYRVIVLSDEAAAYGPGTPEEIDVLAGLHLIQRPPEKGEGRIARIRSHSHAELAQELRRLIQCHNPAVVQLEHVELAGLIEARPASSSAAWVMVLHDVLFSESGESEADRFEKNLLARFEAIITCSADDARMVPGSVLIPNGADICPLQASDSGNVSQADRHAILFCGPFRYTPNLNGIRRFSEKVFPLVRNTFPQTELWILGGKDAPARAAEFSELRQGGITVFDEISDVTVYLAGCALTINPMEGARGSSVKLLESLAAGRVCVTTSNGARGMPETWQGLVAVPAIADMAAPIIRLLADAGERRRREQCALAEVREFDWEESGRKAVALLEQLMERSAAAPSTAGRAASSSSG